MDDISNLAQRAVQQRTETFREMGHPLIMDEFVLKHGKSFERIATDVTRATPRECFANAARLAINNEFFEYTEGYVCAHDFQYPFLHAWIMYDGEIIDNTLETPSNYSYFGIRFKQSFLLSQLAKHKVFGILGGVPEQAYQLVEKVDPSIWKMENYASV